MKPNEKKQSPDPKVAPGLDPDEAYGEDATNAEVEKGDYTTVTKLTYDEYDPSQK